MTSHVSLENIQTLFEQLKTVTNASELDDTLSLINAALEGPEGLKKLQSKDIVPYLQSGLQAASSPVRLVTVKQLLRLSELATSATFFFENGFIPLLVTKLKDEDIGVHESALLALVNICRSSEGLKHVLAPNVIAELQQIAKEHEILSFRVLDLYCRISSLGSEQFVACNSLKLLDAVLEQLNTDDILLQLNTIQLLEYLGTTVNGIQYLQQSGTLRKLWNTVSNPQPYESIILPSVVQTVSSLLRGGDLHFQATMQAVSSGGDPINIFEALRRQLNNDNDEVVLATIWAVSSVAASSSGLNALLDPANKQLFSEWLEFSSSSNGDIRSSLLSAVGSVIDRRPTDDPNDSAPLQTLFSRIFQHIPDANSMERLMKQIDEPLIQLRFAVFAVIKALCKHSWGISTVISYPGFREFLTNRATEHTKRGGEWKFAVIQQIVSHPQSKNLIGVNFWHELLLYIKQGPFYVRHESKVIVEDRVS